MSRLHHVTKSQPIHSQGRFLHAGALAFTTTGEEKGILPFFKSLNLGFMDGPIAGRLQKQATHYEVLGLTTAMLQESDVNAGLIKRAYHRALLQNHPDKAATRGNESHDKYSVDQISQAFTVLSSPVQRAQYDNELRLKRLEGGGQHTFRGFQTGIENVDLDDLDFDDNEGKWYRSCRCGNERGYSFQEDDLIEIQDDGVLLVGCHDCSLWLKVHFAVAEDYESDQGAVVTSNK